MGWKKDNIIMDKSMNLAVRVVNLYQYLCKTKKEFVISQQLLRSGTSIGANIREAQEAISKKDFTSKIYISLKETRETAYWLELLYRTDFLNKDEYISILSDTNEIIRILVAITKSVSKKIK